MSSISYLELCRVRLLHDYFPDQVLTKLVAAPTPTTATRLHRASLLFRGAPNHDGFVLLYQSTSIYQPLFRLTSVFPLTFGLTVTDPFFTNYTDLPLDATADPSVYYLRPAPNQPLEVSGRVAQLALRPLRFELPLSPPHPAGLVQLVRHPPGLSPIGWPVLANEPSLLLDLSPWGSGYYEVSLGNNTPPVAFYADDFLYRTRPWGVLELGPAVLAAASPPASAPEYTLSFEARATYWQYQLTALAPPLPADLRIGTPTSPVPFYRVAPLRGAAVSFLATQTVKLAQRYTQAPYQLYGRPRQAGGNAPVLLPALPQAGPASLRRAQLGPNGGYISDIFVQV